MLPALIITCIALLPVALRAWMGWRLGASSEMRHLLANLFAALVALRYWHPFTATLSEFIKIDPQYLAAAVFLCLFLAAWFAAAFVVNLRGEKFQSVLPDRWHSGLGVFCGLISGALLGGSLMLLLAIALPGKIDGVADIQYPLPLDQLPIAIYRLMETHLAGVPAESPAHSLLPQLQSPGIPPLIWK